MRTLLPLAFTLALGGCQFMQNINPETRLSDIVYQTNDEARWGRIDLAAGRCASGYRAVFIATHRQWGRDVRVADADVTNLSLGEADGGASSLVTYSWIDERTMELHTTTVRQRWASDGDGFRLAGEEIIDGDTALFEEIEAEGEAAETTAERDAAEEEEVEIVHLSEGSSSGSASSGSSRRASAPEDEDDADDLEPVRTSGDEEPPVTATVHRRHRDSQGVLVD